MKVNKTGKIMSIYENTTTNRIKTNRKSSEKDEIKISERAKDYQFGINKVKEVPDIRIEKVDKIKKEIQSGSYNVKGEEIVDKMYENIDFDKRI